MKKMRSPEQKQALMDKIEKAVAEGALIKYACKDAGITASQFGVWKKKLSPRKAFKRKAPKFVDIPAAPVQSSSKCVIVICDTENLKSTLTGLGF